jgi:hypothetical protein
VYVLHYKYKGALRFVGPFTDREDAWQAGKPFRNFTIAALLPIRVAAIDAWREAEEQPAADEDHVTIPGYDRSVP